MPHLILSFTAWIYYTRSHSPTPLQSMSPYTWDDFDPWLRNRSTAGQVFLKISIYKPPLRLSKCFCIFTITFIGVHKNQDIKDLQHGILLVVNWTALPFPRCHNPGNSSFKKNPVNSTSLTRNNNLHSNLTACVDFLLHYTLTQS